MLEPVVVREATALLRSSFAGDVHRGLTARPKSLPSRWLYDRAGSELFERICALPEYYLWRSERSILVERAGQIAGALGAPPSVVELGCGSADKTTLLLDALVARHGRVRYVPVDISATALLQACRALLERHPGLDVAPLAGDWADGLGRLAEEAGPRLLVWLGSSVGNLEPAEALGFLGRARAAMSPGDLALVGIDLAKPRAVLERAYDDAEGVTARFNRNLLVRINRELGGTFAPATFAHRARYDAPRARVEMHLESLRAQTVAIEAIELEVRFDRGETIHTESSYKYTRGRVASLAREARLGLERLWTDRGGAFSLGLLRRP